MQPNIALVILSSFGIAGVCDVMSICYNYIINFFISRLFSQRLNSHDVINNANSAGKQQKITSNNKLETNNLTIKYKENLFQYGVVAVIFTIILRARHSQMDKSKHGWVMHKYGLSIMESLPESSMLVSHTDLDWNTVRYLQVLLCIY